MVRTRFFQLAILCASIASTSVVGSAPNPPAAPKRAPAAPAKNAPSAPAPTTRAPVAGELAELARNAIAAANVRLPKGAVVGGARPTADAQLPIATTRVTIEMTPPPRKAGKVIATAVLVFWKEADIAGRLPIAIELSVPPEALVFDVAKGAGLTLVVQRGEVEVSAPAVTSSDADVGDVIQVLLRPSGRAFRARIVAKDRAVAVEDGK